MASFWKMLNKVLTEAEDPMAADALSSFGINKDSLSTPEGMINASQKFFTAVNAFTTSMLQALDGMEDVKDEAKLKKVISDLAKKNADFNKAMMSLASTDANDDSAKEKAAFAADQPAMAPEQQVDGGPDSVASAKKAFVRK